MSTMQGRIGALLLLAAMAVSCKSPSDTVKDAASNPQAGPQVAGDAGRTTTAPLATATVVPTATLQDLKVTLKGGGMSGTSTIQYGYAFLLENPNPSTAFERTQYQVALYDAAGIVLKTDSGYITFLAPGEKTAVADNMYLDAGAKPVRLDVQVKPGKSQVLKEIVPNFTTENVTYKPDRFSSKVTGVIRSPFKKDLSDLHVSAVAYDANGAIIGGGFTFLKFVPAGGAAAVEVSITTAGTPVKVELYPALSGLTLLGN